MPTPLIQTFRRCRQRCWLPFDCVLGNRLAIVVLKAASTIAGPCNLVQKCWPGPQSSETRLRPQYPQRSNDILLCQAVIICWAGRCDIAISVATLRLVHERSCLEIQLIWKSSQRDPSASISRNDSARRPLASWAASGKHGRQHLGTAPAQ